jgi:hypothetical protein
MGEPTGENWEALLAECEEDWNAGKDPFESDLADGTGTGTGCAPELPPLGGATKYRARGEVGGRANG